MVYMLFTLAVVVTQAAPSVAVFPLEARPPLAQGAADLLTEELFVEVRQTRAFERVVGRSHIEATLGPEARKQLQACAADNCAVVDMELAGALGVSHLLIGRAGQLGSTWVLALQLLDLKTGLVVAARSQRAPGGGPEALLPGIKPAVEALLVEALLVQPAAAPLPEKEAPRETVTSSPLPVRSIVLGGAGVAALAGGGVVALLAGGLGVAAGTVFLLFAAQSPYKGNAPFALSGAALNGAVYGPLLLMALLGVGALALGAGGVAGVVMALLLR